MEPVPQPDPDDRTLLEHCLESVLVEGENALERLCDAHPDLAVLLRRRVAALRELGLLDPPSEHAIPERLGDYRLIELIGRGGMGAVYLAERSSLGRHVALKAIRSEQLFFPGARERFQREVEAIARLQVPGVVPILDVGEADGVPFYVMELFDGVDLARLIRRLRDSEVPHKESGSNAVAAALRDTLPSASDASDDSGLFEGGHAHVAARITMRLARILAHVHEHGIVHRDVKPSNVIVDRYGRVTLVDFGLAHLADAAELTQSGSMLGSLPYMAPEQVRGERADIGPATDVYGIGVTLHELLHLTPAFDSHDVIEMRQLICAGRRAVRTGPRDLETIIACATDPDPARRYPTADALADDLLRFLERRPVRARRTGPLLRTYRWAQRHPARATAATLLALLAVAVPTAIAIERAGAASDLEDALGETERQRGNYERTLTGALDLLDKSTLRLLTHESVTTDGEFDPVRREALQAAAEFYADLRLHDPDNDGIRRAVIASKTRHSEVLATLGELEQALAISEEVLALTRDDPTAARIRFEVRMSRGGIFDRLGDFASTGVEWQAAREEFGKVDDPDFKDRIRLGRSLHGTAMVLDQSSDDGSQQAAREAVAWFEELHRDFPDSAEALCYVAMTRRTLAQILGRARRDSGQFELLSETVSELRVLLERDPGNRTVLAEIGSTLNVLAGQYRYAGRDAEAIPPYEEAASVRREIVRLWPDRDVPASDLGLTLGDLGSALCRAGRPEDALPVLREGIQLVEARRAGMTSSRRLDTTLATLHTWLALAIEETGGPAEEALASHALAVSTLEDLFAETKGKEREAHYALAAARATAVSARFRLGQTDGILEEAEVALTEMKRVIDLAPHDQLAIQQYGGLCLFCASVLVQTIAPSGSPRSISAAASP